MFVRFRNTKTRLQLSLVASRRADGRVCHEHVASFGSIAFPFTAFDRLEFWQQLHARLARLNNRIDAETFGMVLTKVHDRVPMVTQDEQRDLKLKTAEEDARFAQSLHDMHEDTVVGNKGLASKAQASIAAGEAEIAILAKEAETAKERAEKLRSGEDAPGKISRPMTQKEFMAAVGWNAADLRNAKVTQELYRLGAMEEAIQAYVGDKKHERSFFRKVLRKHQRD